MLLTTPTIGAPFPVDSAGTRGWQAAGVEESERCAVHPSRPAVDDCPVCGRPRCAADAAGGACAACSGGSRGPVRRPAGDLERLVRAALGGLAAALPMGFVASEYVGAGLFAYLTPLVLGVLTGEAAQRAAAAPRRGPLAAAVRGTATLLAVLGTALGFVVEASAAPWSGTAVLPYAAAVAGAVVWTSPPGRKKRA